jgi:hypothetical protein
MPKSNKQIIIDAIIKEIENGKERGKVLATLGKKWQLSQRTFDRYWKTAGEQHTVKQQAIKNAIANDTTIKELEAKKQAIMTAIERKEKLTKIANGEQTPVQQMLGNGKISKGFILPTLADQMKAIAELNKMEGDYAPTKTAQTNVNGEDVQQVIIINGKEIKF